MGRISLARSNSKESWKDASNEIYCTTLYIHIIPVMGILDFKSKDQ
jgi:hypothetical protein